MLNMLKQQPDEMSSDLSYRNPIHDALDQDRLIDHKRALETMIEYVGKSKNSSSTSREILAGLMHRILGDHSNNLKQAYSMFFVDNQEDRKQLSKLAVKFSNHRLQRRSKFSHLISYFNDITHINPDVSISNSNVTDSKDKKLKIAKLFSSDKAPKK